MPKYANPENSHTSYALLAAQWSEAFGKPPPKNLSRRLLIYALAYSVQTLVQAALSPSVAQQLRTLAMDARNDAALQLSIGTRLIREWNGKAYVVDVADNGFVMDRRTFRSLSAVAKAITSAHWSGPDLPNCFRTSPRAKLTS